jgi:hypothetical protein
MPSGGFFDTRGSAGLRAKMLWDHCTLGRTMSREFDCAAFPERRLINRVIPSNREADLGRLRWVCEAAHARLRRASGSGIPCKGRPCTMSASPIPLGGMATRPNGPGDPRVPPCKSQCPFGSNCDRHHQRLLSKEARCVIGCVSDY